MINGDYFQELTNFLNRRNLKILSVFSYDIEYDSPFSDQKKNFEPVKNSLTEFRHWLDSHHANLIPLNLIEEKGNPLRAGEALIDLKLDGRDVVLPFAFAFNVNADKKINEIRFYYSHWPIESQHQLRLNIFPLNMKASKIPSDILDHHTALNDGNIDQVIALFADDGSIREPSEEISGPGQESRLGDFFSRTFIDGGVTLVYHTIVDGGARCAAEYSCIKWGQSKIPPQAGIEFFDRASEGERRHFKVVRIYDDIRQPPPKK